MDTQENECWLCGRQVAEHEGVSVNIDGGFELVHEACREAVAKSTAGAGE